MSDQSQPAAEPWAPPTSDQEFTFKDVASAPDWVNKGWASWDNGPALSLPANLHQPQPYTTISARVGDTVKFNNKTQSFTVVPAEPKEEDGTKKLAQESNASLEDALRGGTMTAGDLSADAKAQVASRSPALAKLVEEG